MDFKEFLKEREEEMMGQENDELKAKVVAIFTEGEPVTVETITAKSAELEMEKEELENEVYKVLYDMLNVEDEEMNTPSEEEGGEELEDDAGEMDF